MGNVCTENDCRNDGKKDQQGNLSSYYASEDSTKSYYTISKKF